MQGPRLFLSTLSLRRATCQYPRLFPLRSISIHTLLAESDGGDAAAGDCTAISIHALLAESDAQRQSAQRQPDGFLSTLSLRRATGAATNTRARHLYFYPRSPCGERHRQMYIITKIFKFLSTLSLRRATRHCTTYLNCSRFLSTLSLRRATYSWYCSQEVIIFLSTLSLRRATRLKN